MNYRIENPHRMNRLLWLDTSLGWITAILLFVFSAVVSQLLGVPHGFVLLLAGVNLLYASFSLVIAGWKNNSIQLIRLLIFANLFWAVVSIGLLFYHFGEATLLGKVFLVGQVIVVGGLGLLEKNELTTE